MQETGGVVGVLFHLIMIYIYEHAAVPALGPGRRPSSITPQQTHHPPTNQSLSTNTPTHHQSSSGWPRSYAASCRRRRPRRGPSPLRRFSVGGVSHSVWVSSLGWWLVGWLIV